MVTLKEQLLKFFRFFTQHPTCVSSGLLMLAVTGFEQGFENSLFECPKEYPNVQNYALTMLLAPAGALFALGILCSNLAWRLCQGMNARPDSDHSCGWFRPGCCNLTYITLRVSVVPITWCFVALMDGDLFVCYKFLPTCTQELQIKGVKCTDDPTAWEVANKVQSQLCAWYLLALALGVGFIGVFCFRCFGKSFYYPHIYNNALKRSERMHLEKLLKEKAEAEAKYHAQALIWHQPNMPTADWNGICRESTTNDDSAIHEYLLSKIGQDKSKNILQAYDEALETEKQKLAAAEDASRLAAAGAAASQSAADGAASRLAAAGGNSTTGCI